MNRGPKLTPIYSCDLSPISANLGRANYETVAMMKTDPAKILTVEWDFSDVPNEEIVACCFWEYARESSFIRELRERCLESRRADARKDEQLHADLIKLQSLGYPAEVFMRGFYLESGVVYQSKSEHLPNWRHPEAPPITGDFPQPWQLLSKAERAYRACISSARTAIPLVPFKRGERHDARDIAQWADSRWREIHAAYEKVRRKYPETSEVELVRTGKLAPFDGIQPSLFYEGGGEVTVVWIQWANFTNDEIVEYFRKWVKVNRPKQSEAPDGKGKKLNDWRVALNRLGILRALHAYTFADNRFPTVFKGRGEKFCYAARKSALEKFHELFPFHPKEEKPINWQTKGRRCK